MSLVCWLTQLAAVSTLSLASAAPLLRACREGTQHGSQVIGPEFYLAKHFTDQKAAFSSGCGLPVVCCWLLLSAPVTSFEWMQHYQLHMQQSVECIQRERSVCVCTLQSSTPTAWSSKCLQQSRWPTYVHTYCVVEWGLSYTHHMYALGLTWS